MYLRTLLLTISLLAPGCGERGAQPDQSARPATAPSPAPSPAAAGMATGFNGERAFEDVKTQVGFGPRPAGSPALEKTRAWMIKTLRDLGITVRIDEFNPVTPNGRVRMKNIIAEFPGEKPEAIIIASHYDTKFYKEFRFVGANDGASSTAVLLELARVLATQKTPRKQTLQLVFFDGEEAFCAEWNDCLNGKDNTYGSRHMAEQLVAKKETDRVRAMILLDMVGDSDLRIRREENSSPWLVEAIWSTAGEIGYRDHFANALHFITDDHMPFLQAGIPAVDIIDFDYGPGSAYWHTAEDTIDKISPRSLQIVGDVVLRSLPRIEAFIR